MRRLKWFTHGVIVDPEEKILPLFKGEKKEEKIYGTEKEIMKDRLKIDTHSDPIYNFPK